MPTRLPWLLLLAGSLLAAPAASALGDTTLASGSVRVLVLFEEGAQETVVAGITGLGGTVRFVEPDLRLVGATVPGGSLATATVGALPGVEQAELDDPVRAAGAQWNGAQWNGAQWNGAQWNGAQWNGLPGEQDPGIAIQWGLDAIHAPQAWSTHMGARRADVCVLDSGIAWDHPDLAANMWVGRDGSSGRSFVAGVKSAYDDAGHGTHVAGIVGAVVGNGAGVAGVGNVRLMSAKVLDANGAGYESDLARGLAWCARNGAEVGLMALSASKPGPALDRALSHAADRGLLLVASAGNGGPCGECVAYPASHPKVLAVGAVDPLGAPAAFSSLGQRVDVVAPGVDIASTFVGAGYASGSGTSQAAAMAAGAAALLRDARPDLSASQASTILKESATGPLRQVDAAAALARAG